MIILDTNIISELMKSSPATTVIDWLDQQQTDLLHVTTITIAEIQYGLQSLPNGQRRKALESAFENTILEAFAHRVMPFDDNAAIHYGRIMSARKKSGQPLSILDGQIASIANAQQATLATRNIRDFLNCSIQLINPFTLNSDLK